jgi:glycerol dehydrogenase-like iron-containing ADH family enzyme
VRPFNAQQTGAITEYASSNHPVIHGTRVGIETTCHALRESNERSEVTKLKTFFASVKHIYDQ